MYSEPGVDQVQMEPSASPSTPPAVSTPMHSVTPFSPARSTPSSNTSLPIYKPPTRLCRLPNTVPINQGVSASDGCVMLNWELSLDGQALLSPSAIIALALNEAGRSCGMGKVLYMPLASYGSIATRRGERYRRRRDFECSAEADSKCEREGLSSVPELFYHGSRWSEYEVTMWDRASHVERLNIIRRPSINDNVIPIRLLMRNRINDKLSFTPEPRRLSAAVLVYDNRPFLDWYCNFARRRNGPGPDIEIHLGQDHAKFCDFGGMSQQCTCEGASSFTTPSRGLYMRKRDADMLPPTPTSPNGCSNTRWLSSIRLRDNLAVMHRLSNMWMDPVKFGIVRMAEVLERISQVRGIRRRDCQAASNPETSASIDMRSAYDARNCPVIFSRSGQGEQDDDYDRLFDDEGDDDIGIHEVNEDEVVSFTLQRCMELGVRESVRDIRRCEMADNANDTEDAEQCMFDVDLGNEDSALSGTCG